MRLSWRVVLPAVASLVLARSAAAQPAGPDLEIDAAARAKVIEGSLAAQTRYWRPDNSTKQYWTSPDLSGKRYPNKPVYALTSKETFSGAEELAYDV